MMILHIACVLALSEGRRSEDMAECFLAGWICSANGYIWRFVKAPDTGQYEPNSVSEASHYIPWDPSDSSSLLGGVHIPWGMATGALRYHSSRSLYCLKVSLRAKHASEEVGLSFLRSRWQSVYCNGGGLPGEV